MQDDIRTTAEAFETTALPRCHEVHTNPQAEAPPEYPTDTPIEGKSPARWAYERLILYIRNFEESLDNQHEVAIGHTGAEAGVIRIEGMGFFDPDIVTFYGTDLAGTKTQLIQHYTQLNVMLRAMPKRHDQAGPNRIGFRLAQDLDDVDKLSSSQG